MVKSALPNRNFGMAALGQPDSRWPAIGMLPVLVIVTAIVISVLDPRFGSASNLTNVLRTTALLTIIACGEAVVLIVGGLDLSVGSTVALASVTGATAMRWSSDIYPESEGLAITLGVAVSLSTGLLVGVVNGICVAVLRVSGFITTLGTMSMVFGIAFMMTNGIPVYGLPQSLIAGFGRARWFLLPSAVYVAAFVLILLAFMQQRTATGRHLYAIGGSMVAANVSGLRIKGLQIFAYMVSGLLAALTGLVLTAVIGSGQASFGGDLMMLQSIAAAVIGGVSLNGGIGKVWMVALSALFLSLVANALNLLHIDSRIQPIFSGVILIAAVGMDEIKRQRTGNE